MRTLVMFKNLAPVRASLAAAAPLSLVAVLVAVLVAASPSALPAQDFHDDAPPAAQPGDTGAGFTEPYDDHAFDRPPGEPAPPPRHAYPPASERDARSHGDRWEQRPTRHHDFHYPDDPRPYRAPRRPGSRFLTYMQDRLLDATDFFRFKIGFGGFGAAARVTTLAQIGAVYTNGPYFGVERRAVGVWREERFAAGLGPLWQTDIITSFWGGNEFADPASPWNHLVPSRGYVRSDLHWDDGRNRFLSVAAELHLGIIGVDIAFYPEEVFDFLFGFVGIDFLGDDIATLERHYGGEYPTHPAFRRPVRDERHPRDRYRDYDE